MAEEQAPAEKKVSMVEGLLMIMLSLLFDGIELILGLLLIGEITNPVTNVFFSGVFAFWFTMRGIKLPSFILGAILEFVPIINLLPIRTATVIISIIIANNATLSKTVGVVSGAKGLANTAKNFKSNLENLKQTSSGVEAIKRANLE